jgi:hypothetical protein
MISQPYRSVSRRTALAGLGGGLGVALAARGGSALAQEGDGDMGGHPLAGTWLALTAGGVVPQTHNADGSMIAAFPPNYVDPALGLTFQGPALGQWEPIDERRGRFTFIQALADADGTYLGTFQLSAGIEASEDGQTWVGNDEPRIIMRDAANAVLMDEIVPIEPAVTGTRIGATAESVVLPEMAAMVATPQP